MDTRERLDGDVVALAPLDRRYREQKWSLGRRRRRDPEPLRLDPLRHDRGLGRGELRE